MGAECFRGVCAAVQRVFARAGGRMMAEIWHGYSGATLGRDMFVMILDFQMSSSLLNISVYTTSCRHWPTAPLMKQCRESLRVMGGEYLRSVLQLVYTAWILRGDDSELYLLLSCIPRCFHHRLTYLSIPLRAAIGQQHHSSHLAWPQAVGCPASSCLFFVNFASTRSR